MAVTLSTVEISPITLGRFDIVEDLFLLRGDDTTIDLVTIVAYSEIHYQAEIDGQRYCLVDEKLKCIKIDCRDRFKGDCSSECDECSNEISRIERAKYLVPFKIHVWPYQWGCYNNRLVITDPEGNEYIGEDSVIERHYALHNDIDSDQVCIITDTIEVDLLDEIDPITITAIVKIDGEHISREYTYHTRVTVFRIAMDVMRDFYPDQKDVWYHGFFETEVPFSDQLTIDGCWEMSLRDGDIVTVWPDVRSYVKALYCSSTDTFIW